MLKICYTCNGYKLEMSDNMDFRINEFEGPLDLLLHLIKESKMDIMDIEIEKITEQYNMEVENVKNIIPEKDLVRDILVEKAMNFVRENAVSQ